MNGQKGGRPTHTSHGAGGMRGTYNNSNANNIHNEALKNRASSSYGSLQSRTTNAVVSSSSIVKQFQGGKNTALNKSGISATSNVMLNQSGHNSNARYYQDQTGSVQNDQTTNDKLNTLGSQNNLNNTVTPQSGVRPITRDVKLRSQAGNKQSGAALSQNISNSRILNNASKQNKTGSTSNNYSQQQNYQTNNIINTNASAISGGGSGAKTFQNTINIGSFINEINNQQNKDQVGPNIQTFSNTIDNTDGSNEGAEAFPADKDLKQGDTQSMIDQQIKNDLKGAKLASILNTGSQGSTEIQQLVAGPTTANQFHTSIVTIQTAEEKAAAAHGRHGSNLVISGAQEVTGTMNIQDDKDKDGIESQDIRKIKLNYIQLNKRATTASTGNGRKIPQKGQSSEYSNFVSQKPGQTFQPNQTQKTATANAYQDVGQKDNMRNTMTNFSPAQFEMQANQQYRQLQTRQTRRLITAGAAQGGKQEQPPLDLEQQQNNYAHLAYQVDKYQDPADPGVAIEGEQNQFCTDASTIENIDNYIIGKRIG